MKQLQLLLSLSEPPSGRSITVAIPTEYDPAERQELPYGRKETQLCSVERTLRSIAIEKIVHLVEIETQAAIGEEWKRHCQIGETPIEPSKFEIEDNGRCATLEV